MYDEEIDVIKREAVLMGKLDHPCIVRYHDSYQASSGRFCIVMELASGNTSNYIGGTLYDRIHDGEDEPLPESTVVNWLCQLCLALRYLHSKRIIHRDLKTQNIFISSRGRIKLGDFGIARTLTFGEHSAKSYVGTPLYLAPEIVMKMYFIPLCRSYTEKCDMWSLGVVLYEMCNKAPPFRGCSLDAVSQAILAGKYLPINPCYSRKLTSIVDGLLCSNPALRLSASDVLNTKLCRAAMRNLVSIPAPLEKANSELRNISKQQAKVPQTLYDCRFV